VLEMGWCTIPELFVPEFHTGTYHILYPFIFFHLSDGKCLFHF
jgi:hypothetical protein